VKGSILWNLYRNFRRGPQFSWGRRKMCWWSFAVRKSGALLSVMIFLGSFCLSTACQAQGFLEMLFGGGHQAAAAHETRNYAPEFRSRSAALAIRHGKYAHLRHKKNHHAARFAMQRSLVVSSYLPAPKTLHGEAKGAGVGIAESNACCSDAPAAILKILHEDPTLRPGDAYMTSDGLKVFVGAGKSDPQFVPVDKAHRIGRVLQARLAAMVMHPVVDGPAFEARHRRELGPSAKGEGGQKLASGGKERLIKTKTGKIIRLVGGYAS
jgi:hypothetical protein